MRLNVLIIFLVAFVCGCSATGQKYSELAPVVTGGKSEIVIYRKSQMAASGGCYRVKLDGEQIGILQNGGYLRKFVEPGKHTITAVIEKDLNIEIETKENSQNFIFLNIGLAGLSAFPIGTVSVVNASWNVALIDTPQEFGAKAVQELRESTTLSTCMSK